MFSWFRRHRYVDACDLAPCVCAVKCKNCKKTYQNSTAPTFGCPGKEPPGGEHA